MRRATLFNLDALFELIVGFVLLFNPLLGPVLPVPGWVVAIVGVALLVAACVIGRAGMGKGGLVAKIRTLGLVNAASGVMVGAWAIVGCSGGGRILMLIIAAGLLALGIEQIVSGGRPETPGKVGRVNTVRATTDELSRALHHKRTD